MHPTDLVANPLLILPGITKEQWGFEQCMGSAVGMGGRCHFKVMGAVLLPGGVFRDQDHVVCAEFDTEPLLQA